MDNLTDLAARPHRLEARGRVYLIYPLTIGELGELQEWIDAQFPDPFAVVHAELQARSYNVTQQQYLLDRALHHATRGRRLLGTPEADQLFNTLEGVQQLLYLSIRKGDPGFTREDAKDLYLHLTLAQLTAVMSATSLDLVLHDPKGRSGTPASNGSTTSRPTAAASTGGSSTTTRRSSSRGRRTK